MRRMYSKGQIESIVNNGIQGGSIQAGTKLYTHALTLVDETELQVINNSPASLIGEDIFEIFANCLVMKNASADYEIILAPKGDTGFYYVSAGSVDSIDLTNSEIASDLIESL